ncbi:MAG: cobyric acid synthase [Treponemataceae bacterium]|nr:cobyric acid synthase [Treponemataceae bacterium]
MLKTSNLCVGYNKKILIDGINFNVQAGKILTLIGPNGSGKSTVLKTIIKELKALGGSVSLTGKNLFSEKEAFVSRHLSMVMTERIHPEMMTVREVVATGRYPYTGRLGILSDEDWKITEEAMKTVHCEKIADCNFNMISDGQRQRVMLARAICQDTEVIVLDEPVTFLDMYYKLDFLKTVKNLALRKNKAIIMSLHDLDLVKKISDLILCLDGEKIVKIGTSDEIFRDDFIQKLYGLNKDEFNPETGMLVWDCARDCSGGEAVVKQPAANNGGAQCTGTTESPTRQGCAHKKAKILMIQGTMSNAGKSLVVAGLCRIFKQDGYKVAPFKSQNMALNSFITRDGFEMGRAQVMQAEAAGIEPDVAMNPILLKPTNDTGSQVIVNGEVMGNMPAREYFEYKKSLVPEIMKAFHKLEDQYDIIVIEGAGSPAEINLRKNDIVNMGLAEMVDAPVLLVGDIDRGGVFAQLLGTIELLEKSERERIKGLIINKFRGDKSLLDSGIVMLEEKGGIPVTGVLPYMQLSIDDEDSLSTRFESRSAGIVNIGVIKFPRISNFTDFNVFDEIDGVSLHYIKNAGEIPAMDMIILPGSKNTIADLKWMRENGMEAAVKKFSANGLVFGICGGYQMLGKNIHDPENVEEGGTIRGIELLDTETVLLKEKTRTQTQCNTGKVSGALQFLSDRLISGYEIHMGKTKIGNADSFPCGASCGNVYGSYIHGFFDEGDIAFTLCSFLAQKKGMELSGKSFDYKAFKESQYDLLADGIRKNLNMEAIYGILEQ